MVISKSQDHWIGRVIPQLKGIEWWKYEKKDKPNRLTKDWIEWMGCNIWRNDSQNFLHIDINSNVSITHLSIKANEKKIYIYST